MVHEAHLRHYTRTVAPDKLTGTAVCSCGATFNVELIGGQDSQLIQSIVEGYDYGVPLAEVFCPYRRIEKLETAVRQLQSSILPIG